NRLLAEVVVEICLAWQAAAGRPSDFEFTCRLHRLPRLLRDDAHEILPNDDFHHAREILHRAFVYANHRRAHRRRPHYSAVQHAGHAYVVDEFELAGGQCRKIGAFDRFAQHSPLAWMFALGIAIEAYIEFAAAYEFAIGHFF